MKLLFAIKGLHDANGGAERVICQISSELSDRGYDVVLVTFDKPGENPFYPVSDDVKHIGVGIGNVHKNSGVKDTLKRIVVLQRIVAREKPDLIVPFMHSMFVPLTLATLGSGIPIVAGEHIVPERYRTRRLQFIMFCVCAVFARAITVLTPRMTPFYPSFLRRKITVMPNPVAVPQQAERVKKVSGERKIVLNVGRFHPVKDQVTLIKAFAQIADNYPEWDLRIIGDGEIRQDLEKAVADTGMQNRVFLPGLTDKVDEEYKKADIFVVSSKVESFGLVACEAMSYGLPVVGFATCPGTNELIEHGKNGILVEGSNRISALASGIEHLINNPDICEEMGQFSRGFVHEFNPGTITDKWEKLINKTVLGVDKTIIVKDKKIMFAVKGLNDAKGGAEKIICQMASAMAERGYNVSLMSFDKSGGTAFYPISDKVRRIYIGIGDIHRKSGWRDTVKRMIAIRRILRIENPDLAIPFMHSMFIPLSFAAFGLKVKVIGSEHIVPIYYKERKFEYLLLVISCFFMNRLTVISDAIKQMYPRIIRSKTVVIPNPVDLIACVKYEEEKNKTRNIILNVGRLDPQKDQKTLIKAFSLISDKYPDWDLRIIGVGELEQDLKNLVADLNLQDRVFLPGGTDRIKDEYCGADIFAISSLYESFGLVTAEAMVNGLPVVGFADCSGTNELIEHKRNGLLVSGADRAAALAGGIETLIKNPDLCRVFVQRAKRRVTVFSEDKIADKWEQLICRTIGAD